MNINTVTLTGNLTKDPELRVTKNGTKVCDLRVAVNSSRKQDEEWVEYPNYFTVSVWGKQGESCAEYLAKGRPVAVQGELAWSEWENEEGGKREQVKITANKVQFLGGKPAEGADASTDAPATQTKIDDDIPF